MENEVEEQTLDPRVRRTRIWLQDALATLLQEKSFADISITDITKEADLARITFYQHFASKEALLLSVVEEFFTQIYDAFDLIAFREFVEQGTVETAAKVNAIRELEPRQLLLIQVALQEIGPAVRELVATALMKKSATLTMLDQRQLRLLAIYHAGGVLALMEEFLQGAEELSPDGMKTIPVIFLRALAVEAVRNGLLGKVLAAP